MAPNQIFTHVPVALLVFTCLPLCLIYPEFNCTGKCLKPEQFLKAKHQLKHAFPYRDGFFMVLIVKDY